MVQFLEKCSAFLWGVPLLILILELGSYLSVRTGFLQLRLLPKALTGFFRSLRKDAHGKGVSSFQALCAALAATVGTGNIAGVAGAITLGGPGSIFWMWCAAFLGMILKFAEAALAVYFRKEKNGTFLAGPMYTIQNGLPSQYHFLAALYAFFGIVACFGVGNAAQVNAAATAAQSIFGHSNRVKWTVGLVLALLTGLCLLGGVKRIASFAEFLVPFASVTYLVLGAWVLAARICAVPAAFFSILQGAWDPKAVTGGAVGSAFLALRIGVSRGTFTNEAGMGTAAIAHGSAENVTPLQQGLMGIVEVFLDTIVICTVTALVILCSGIPVPYGTDTGAGLTIRAFSSVCGNWAGLVITLCLCAFAFATLLGWGLYGVRCAQFLFGSKSIRLFTFLQILAVVLGAVLPTDAVWILSELFNGLMAIPNLISLAVLSPLLSKIQKT